jgi:hypothetical protein
MVFPNISQRMFLNQSMFIEILSGTDVMIFKIFSLKKFDEKNGTFDKTKLNYAKFFHHNIGFRGKRQFFRRKL